MSRKLILTRGIQASGKSTWARKWAEEDPGHRLRVNNDDIRNMMGIYWQTNREPLVKRALDNIVCDALMSDYDVVVDNMNLNPKEWNRWQTVIDGLKNEHNLDVDLEFEDFLNVSVSECIERDSKRENPIGAKVIKDTFNRYRSFIIEQVNKAEVERWSKQDPNLPKAIIVDMDATLCMNTSGRPFFGEGAAEGMKNDVEIPGICELVKSMQARGVEVIVVTGREATVEIIEATHEWLHAHGIHSSNMNFRGVGDYSKGDVCKEKLYNEHIKGKYNILFVLEDSKKCVDMWRRNGLICLQPNEGNF